MKAPSWVYAHRFELALAGVILAAALLRLYQLPDFMHFRWDEGRFALRAKEMVDNHTLLLVGQPASIAPMAGFSPIWFYLLVPALAIFQWQPLGGAVLTVVLDLAAIILAYRLVRRLSGPGSGLLIALLWAFRG